MSSARISSRWKIPVEYMIHGLNQVHVNPKAGLDFASGLRAILRQDPDIIMIGEIRDQETVEIAIRAAITGHLVLSTIHTNNAPGTISRLLDMGVEPYMLSAAIVGIIAQRLVRKICPICKKQYIPEQGDLKALGIPPDTAMKFYTGTGCGNCAGTGTKGRMAVHEILTINSEVRNLIPMEDSASKIRDYLAKKRNQNYQGRMHKACIRRRHFSKRGYFCRLYTGLIIKERGNGNRFTGINGKVPKDSCIRPASYCRILLRSSVSTDG